MTFRANPICGRCGTVRDLKNNNGTMRCRTCTNAQSRERAKINRMNDPEGVREWDRERRKTYPKHKSRVHFWYIFREYGLTEAGYHQLLESQGNHCAICPRKLGVGHETHVDHDHATGIVRGLLCRWCNLGLGNFRDSIDTMESAINYLSKNREKQPCNG